MVTNPFDRLPRDAAPDTIYAEAGELFAARKADNPLVDFDTEVWYLAGNALEAADLPALRGMTTEQVARAMGDSISRWINSAKIVSAFEGRRFNSELSQVMPYFVVRLLSDPERGTRRFCDERGKFETDAILKLYERLIAEETFHKAELDADEWDAMVRTAATVGAGRGVRDTHSGGRWDEKELFRDATGAIHLGGWGERWDMLRCNAETYAAVRRAAKAIGIPYVWEDWDTVRDSALTYGDARRHVDTFTGIGGPHRDDGSRAARRAAESVLVSCIWAAESNSAAVEVVDGAYATAIAYASKADIIWNDDMAFHGFDSTHDFAGLADYEKECADFAADCRERYFGWIKEVLLDLLL